MNLDNYLVELEKLKFYRDRISQQIIHSGRYPNQFELQHKLNDINLRIAIFQNKLIEEKDIFNTKEFNDKFEAIYQDLLILYKVVYQLSVQKYLDLMQKCIYLNWNKWLNAMNIKLNLKLNQRH